MPDPVISAIICTHNRDGYLGAAIDSLINQDFSDDFEVIVVDNASSDRTSDVVNARLPHPQLRYVYEPVTGLSVARNTGAEAAGGSILAYLDDDAIASPQWLRSLYAAYQTDDQLAVAGGRITLIWPPDVEPPRWLSPGLAGNLGLYDLGESTMLIHQPGLTPRGLNYSIRKEFLEDVGGFDLNLGRVGTTLLSNEELRMTELALTRGWHVAYIPEAHVEHNVAPERLARAWFLNRSWWQGISECYREQLAGRSGRSQLMHGGERFLRGVYRSLTHLHDPAQRFDNFVYAYGQIGYVGAALRGMIHLNVESSKSFQHS